jgi:hypothetical protein
MTSASGFSFTHGKMPRKDDRSAEEDTLKAAKWPVMTVT